MEMEVYFSDYKKAFGDQQKISTTLTNMEEGKASKWAQPLLCQLLDGTTHKPLESWEGFKEVFLLAFRDPIKKD